MIKVAVVVLSLITPVHSWYSPQCCSDQDCEPIPCEDIGEDSLGNMVYRGLTFNFSMIHPSQDNRCHACIHEFSPDPKTPMPRPICLYIQSGT